MFFIPRRIASSLVIALCACANLVQGQAAAASVESIRFWSFGDVTRVAIGTSGDYKLYTEQIEKPSRVFFDLAGLQPPNGARNGMQIIPVGDQRIRQIRVARLSGGKTRIVLDLESPAEVSSSQLVNPDRLMIEVRPKGTSLPALSASKSVVGSHTLDPSSSRNPVDNDIDSHTVQGAPGPAPASANNAPLTMASVEKSTATKIPVRNTRVATAKNDPNDAYHPPRKDILAKEARPNLSSRPTPEVNTLGADPDSTATSPLKSEGAGDRSLVRVFGLKMARVVIDPGHGGHDSGTIGPNGLMEKDLVLDVALRLGAMITKQMGAEVIYTRSTDVFIPLEERTRIANQQKADLFISVHANSSPEPAATGVETYYFNLTSDKGGLDLATRENATADSSISDLSDLLHRAVLQAKREESRDFAQRVQASLIAASQKSNNRVRDRGVRQAPFVVLIGATMPSILAEIGFVSNPRDEKLLRKPEQRQKIADALFKGVAQYANSLSHVQIARAGKE